MGAGGEGEGKAAPVPAVRVLVVDDSPVDRKVVELLLRNHKGGAAPFHGQLLLLAFVCSRLPCFRPPIPFDHSSLLHDPSQRTAAVIMYMHGTWHMVSGGCGMRDKGG